MFCFTIQIDRHAYFKTRKDPPIRVFSVCIIDIILCQCLLESADEVIDVGTCDAERWEQTDDVGAAATGEAVEFLDQSGTDFLVWHVEFDADHQSAAAYIDDMWQVLCLQAVDEVFAY